MYDDVCIWRVARVAAAGVMLALLPVGLALADNGRGNSGDSESQIQRGYEINPVTLDLAGKNRAWVGLGSYIVNTSGCNDCHTHPSYLPGHDPFLGEPEAINAAQYLTGGRKFGPGERPSAFLVCAASAG